MHVRQNTYVTRKSNSVFPNLIPIEFEETFDKLDKKERHRAVAIGIRLSRPMLNELVAYHDGHRPTSLRRLK